MDTAGVQEPSKISPPQDGQKCASCGGSYVGIFCPDCGEKKRDKHDYSIAHFLEQAFETFAHADSRLFRSIRLLMTKPGFLTLQFMMGRRKPYPSPIQLFIVVNLMFLLVNALSLSLPTMRGTGGLLNLVFYRSPTQRNWTDELLEKKAAKKHVANHPIHPEFTPDLSPSFWLPYS